jgi:hypothetical protein
MTPLTPTEDIRAARHKLAAKFNNELDRIVADLRSQESESDAEFVTLPSRSPRPTTNQGMHKEPPTVGIFQGESNSAAR